MKRRGRYDKSSSIEIGGESTAGHDSAPRSVRRAAIDDGHAPIDALWRLLSICADSPSFNKTTSSRLQGKIGINARLSRKHMIISASTAHWPHREHRRDGLRIIKIGGLLNG